MEALLFILHTLVTLLVVAFLLRLVAGATLNPAVVLTAGFLSLLHTVLQFYFIAVLLYALLSWFAAAGYNPVHDILTRLCEPLLAPVRRVIPPLGGLDLSVLFVLIALQALQILLR